MATIWASWVVCRVSSDVDDGGGRVLTNRHKLSTNNPMLTVILWASDPSGGAVGEPSCMMSETSYGSNGSGSGADAGDDDGEGGWSAKSGQFRTQ